jgi:hypothetical protein
VAAAFIPRRAVVGETANGFLGIVTVAVKMFSLVFYVVTDKKLTLSPSGRLSRNFFSTGKSEASLCK